MAEHSRAATWLMLCTLVACFGMPAIGSAADLAELLNSGTVNASSPSPMDLSNVTTGTVPRDNSTSVAGGSNETNTTVLAGMLIKTPMSVRSPDSSLSCRPPALRQAVHSGPKWPTAAAAGNSHMPLL